MKLRTEILEISHDELVNFISTATYGDNTFEVEIPDECENLKTKGEGDCWEDHIANVLLNGGYINVYDNESYDEDVHNIDDADAYEGTESYEPLWDEESHRVMYRFTLKDVITAFNTILSAEIDSDDNDTRCLRENFDNTFVNESGDFYDAWNLLQFVIFGKVNYE